MGNYAEPSPWEKPSDIQSPRFHSVEFPINSLKLKYQCRLRENGITAMFVLVKENSDILHCLRVGDILTMKYYCVDSATPPETLETEIQFITKNDSGKFKGHYLVGLNIVHSDDQERFI